MCGEEVKRGMHTFEFLLAIYCDTALPCGYHVDAISLSGGGIRGALLVRVRVVSWKTCRTALVVMSSLVRSNSWRKILNLIRINVTTLS